MANEIIKTQLHPQKPADESDIIYPETSVDQVKGLPVISGPEKQAVVVNGDGYSTAPYNAPTQVRVGETQTLPEGYPASVQNVGTPTAPILNFQIPQGKTGMQGQRGPKGEPGDGQIFYILSHNIDNDVEDVTLSVPTSEFTPDVEPVKGTVVWGISTPTGALFSALPDYDGNTFSGTFTVTTLGYAGVAHGGTISKTLDINANVHIGRGNTDSKLYVRKISFDYTDEERHNLSNIPITITSQVLFNSAVYFGGNANFEDPVHIHNLSIGEGKSGIFNVDCTAYFSGNISIDRDSSIYSNGFNTVLEAHNGTIACRKLSIISIGKSSSLTIEDPFLDCALNANGKRIYDCKINTNPISVNLAGVTSNFEVHFVNIYDGSDTSITTDGDYEVVFPCMIYAVRVNEESLAKMNFNSDLYRGLLIKSNATKLITQDANINLDDCVMSEPDDGYVSAFISLLNYNKPITGGKIHITLG